MQPIFKIILALTFICAGCSSNKGEVYVPSIGQLKAGESLIMNILECHRGCWTATVEFKDGYAGLIPYEIDLTPEDISELESYFGKAIDFDANRPSFDRTLKLTAKEISDLDRYFTMPANGCSNVIKISFEHKRDDVIFNNKGLNLYPCITGSDSVISPTRLIIYLDDTNRFDIPFWRLSAAEHDEWIKNLYGPRE